MALWFLAVLAPLVPEKSNRWLPLPGPSDSDDLPTLKSPPFIPIVVETIDLFDCRLCPLLVECPCLQRSMLLWCWWWEWLSLHLVGLVRFRFKLCRFRFPLSGFDFLCPVLEFLVRFRIFLSGFDFNYAGFNFNYAGFVSEYIARGSKFNSRW